MTEPTGKIHGRSHHAHLRAAAEHHATITPDAAQKAAEHYSNAELSQPPPTPAPPEDNGHAS